LPTEGEVVSSLEAIVLAAGAGTRFGGAKLTSPWRGRRLIHGAVAAALSAPVRAVTVVVGADPAVAKVLGRDPRLRLVRAVDHAQGMAASLRAGIGVLPADTTGVFVFLGDMPLIPIDILRPLALALAKGASAAAPLWAGRRGHPVLFSRTLFPELLALAGDQGAKSLLDGLGDRLKLVESPDDGVLFDIDLRTDSPRGAGPRS
jgi:molybdenum cofactor cytidylyltransferase